MTTGLCTDPRLTLGAGLSALASALVTAAWPGWVGVGLVLAAAVVLLGAAGWTLRPRAPIVPPVDPPERAPDSVTAALRALR